MKKKTQMFHILEVYSMTLILIITIFSIVVSLVYFINTQNSAKADLSSIGNRYDDLLTDSQEKTNRIAAAIYSDSDDVSDVQRFFSMTDAQYLKYNLTQNVVRSFPKKVSENFFNENDIHSISFNLNSEKKIYVATDSRKMGYLTKNFEALGVKFHRTIYSPETFLSVGTMLLEVDQNHFDRLLKNYDNKYDASVFLISDTNQVIYQNTKLKRFGQKLVDNLESKEKAISEKYYYREIKNDNGYRTIVLTPKREVFSVIMPVIVGLFIFSFIIDSILLLLLFKLFQNYRHQISNILNSITRISQNDLHADVELPSKTGELYEISSGINEMLKSLNLYIKENYTLEIQQKDANMRALQSQINPHFLYNTLEYIRMYAVSEGQDELAEVVFAFASLLRNNTTQSKTNTLKNELLFCEKYVYLYQMRYPDRVAYNFSLDPELEELEIPKFSIQPLVENYFKHGIDFTRKDNALSVKAFVYESTIVIQVKDNGQGMSFERLQQVKASLNQPYEVGKSIGLQNVNERLKAFWENRYSLNLFINETGGLTIELIYFKGE